jgi:sortase A
LRVHIKYRWKPRVLAQRFFLVAGLLSLGYAGSIYTASFIHQARESRNFDRDLAHSQELAPGIVAALSIPQPPIKPQTGELIGKIQIPRLGLAAVVDEGVDDKTLALSVGHIPYTGLPGQPGNVGLAAHRDTFFRPLQNIQRDDIITLTTLRGEFSYRVVSTKVTSPSDVAVLDFDGNEILTLVTCYPFYFVGSAPERFIVRAERVTDPPTPRPGSATT